MKIIVDTPAAQQQTATINYAAPRPVNIGDVFYRVECGELQHFREPCRVCGDKRELTVKGVTFRCPCCDKEKTTISVAPYIVRRYRVNVIKEAALDYEWNLATVMYIFAFIAKSDTAMRTAIIAKTAARLKCVRTILTAITICRMTENLKRATGFMIVTNSHCKSPNNTPPAN